MVRKKVLERLLEEERKKTKELEEMIDFYKSQHERDMIIIEELRKMNELGQLFGDRTLQSNYVSNTFHYIKTGEKDKAKTPLKILFYDKEKNRIRFYKFEDEYRKEFFSPDRNLQIHNAKLKESWVFIRHENREKASIPQRVYKVVKEEKESQHDLPNIPEIIQVEEFVLMKEIIGPDLFTFFNQLRKKPCDETIRKQRDSIRRVILKKHLKDTAYLRTKDFGFPHHIIVPSTCEEKIVETFKKYLVLGREAEQKLRKKGRILDLGAYYNFRDAGLWNVKLEQGVASAFLSDKILSYEYIHDAIAKGLSQYDFDTIIRKTFGLDDAIHILQSPVLNLSQKEILKGEEYFLEESSKYGGNFRHHLMNRYLESFYRHLRLWDLYEQGKLPREKEHYSTEQEIMEFKYYHLRMSYSNLYMYVCGEQAQEKELGGVSLEKILSLAMKA